MKITKRELLRRIEALEEWSIGADDMLTELNHALPDPEYDAKCAENAVAVEESLERHAVRLGLKNQNSRIWTSQYLMVWIVTICLLQLMAALDALTLTSKNHISL